MIRECVVRGCPRVGYAQPTLVCETVDHTRVTAALDMPHCQRHMEAVTIAEILTDETWKAISENGLAQILVLVRDTVRVEWTLL